MFSRLQSRSWTTATLSLVVLVLTAGMADGQQESERPAVRSETATDDAMVSLLDGRRLHLKCAGAGEPTVILDAGLGLDSSIWARVQPGLAEITRTCAYDRAGYGRSDPGPLPRDYARRTSDLLELLDATAETGPFVLVAHSAAEVSARLAVVSRREVIAGLVLVDPGADLETLTGIGPVWATAHEAGQSAALKCIRATAAGEMRPGNAIYVECGSPPTDGPLGSREMAAAVLSENEPDPTGMGEVKTAAGSLGDVPVIVLTAANKFGANEGAAPTETIPLRRAWSEAGARIAASSTRGEQRMVQDASHVIQFEEPQAVIDAVRDVLEMTRSGTARAGPTS